MPSKPSPFSFFAPLILATLLTACTGMSPGGGAPTEVAQGGGAVGAGNSLDVGSGGGSPLGGGGSSGEAVPSTQQSTDSIGSPCLIRFKVTVKILRNGAEEPCVTATARLRPLDLHDTNPGGMAPPEDSFSPKVTMNFFIAPDSPFNANKTHDTECVEGRWLTVNDFTFRFPSVDMSCEEFQVSAQANWTQEDKHFSSPVFQGPPVPERDADYAVPLDLVLDLGGISHPIHDIDSTTDSVLTF